MDRGAWQATVPGKTNSRIRLSDFHFHVFAEGSVLFCLHVSESLSFYTY